MGRRLLFLMMTLCSLTGCAAEFLPTDAPLFPGRSIELDFPIQPADEAEFEALESDMPVDSTPMAPSEAMEAMGGVQFQQLSRATVHIALLNSRRQLVGFGSGSILTHDGLILTNAHVVQPSAMGIDGQDPALIGIELLVEEDEPPVPAYFASVVAVDGTLDLAVLRIDRDLDGSPIDRETLDLPTVSLGDSDAISIGNELFIFGYPGIGGDTITVTRDIVSGFSVEEPIGKRAWIKTTATIAGGSSGGLAANAKGQLIGVPTQASVGAASDVTDCRVVQDTNGDNRLDRLDNCIPIGGFINSLRPINLAKPLIRAAEAEMAYISPFGQSGLSGVLPARGDMTFRTFAADFDSDTGCAVEPLVAYPSDSRRVVAVFGYSNLERGAPIAYAWQIDGVTVLEDVLDWDGAADGACFPFFLENGGDLMPDGVYTLRVVLEGQPPIEATTEVGGMMAGTEGVIMQGQIGSVATGRGVSEALVIILRPGVSVDEWVAAPNFDLVYSSAETDASGFYEMPDLLQRGVRYEAIVAAEGYADERGFVAFDERDDEIVVINIQLIK